MVRAGAFQVIESPSTDDRIAQSLYHSYIKPNRNYLEIYKIVVGNSKGNLCDRPKRFSIKSGDSTVGFIWLGQPTPMESYIYVCCDPKSLQAITRSNVLSMSIAAFFSHFGFKHLSTLVPPSDKKNARKRFLDRMGFQNARSTNFYVGEPTPRNRIDIRIITKRYWLKRVSSG